MLEPLGRDGPKRLRLRHGRARHRREQRERAAGDDAEPGGRRRGRDYLIHGNPQYSTESTAEISTWSLRGPSESRCAPCSCKPAAGLLVGDDQGLLARDARRDERGIGLLEPAQGRALGAAGHEK